MASCSFPDGSLTSVTPDGDVLRVREVWQDNLEDEVRLIRQVVDEFSYVAMDTEFPGVVARPLGTFRSSGEYHYQTLRLNVDALRLIQLGLTFSDANGRLPRVDGELCVWQFNFREFSPRDDLCAPDSIRLLEESGIDFAQNASRGVDARSFAVLLTTSGVVLNPRMRWITFHAGYDFGYLLKVLTGRPLPARERDFFEALRVFFPTLYDIKYLMKFCQALHGGLNKLAELLDVARIGPQHQAGSDSLLTSHTFLKLQATHFPAGVEKHAGVLYGLGTDGAQELLGQNE